MRFFRKKPLLPGGDGIVYEHAPQGSSNTHEPVSFLEGFWRSLVRCSDGPGRRIDNCSRELTSRTGGVLTTTGPAQLVIVSKALLCSTN